MRGIASGVGGDIYSAPMRQDNYFEYHLYTLARPTSILDKQTKQVSLLNAREVPIQKTLELRGSNYYYQTGLAELGTRLPVAVYLSFQNRGGDLGIPLPAGTVRLYQNDFANLSQFLGSDSIDHTLRNETVRLHLGDSFDVTARKRQTDFQLITNCTSEGTYILTSPTPKLRRRVCWSSNRFPECGISLTRARRTSSRPRRAQIGP